MGHWVGSMCRAAVEFWKIPDSCLDFMYAKLKHSIISCGHVCLPDARLHPLHVNAWELVLDLLQKTSKQYKLFKSIIRLVSPRGPPNFPAAAEVAHAVALFSVY